MNIVPDVMPYTRTILTRAVGKLGPIGAHNALTAFDKPENRASWYSCGLALTYGSAGELLLEMEKREEGCRYTPACYRVVGEIVGLSAEEARIFADAFDGMEASFPSEEAPALLRRLLEAEAAKIRTSPSEAKATPAGAVA